MTSQVPAGQAVAFLVLVVVLTIVGLAVFGSS